MEQKNSKVIVMKFGGSSLGDGQHILHVADIVANYSKDNRIVVVVSAMYKVTDTLISLFERYKTKNFEKAFEEITYLYNLHKKALDDFELTKAKHEQVTKKLTKLFGDLHMHLTLNTNYTASDYDYCISFGERLSSYLLETALQKRKIRGKAIDASKVIVADNEFGNAKALIKQTETKAKKSLSPLLSKNIIPVVTGFFASTLDGKVVTLGRGGSDYSATILAHALDAHEVILWKEVDGVFSADPKKNTDAIFYSDLSYEEALSLAEKGAKILHPEAMKPVASKGIVVRVKNTFKPEFPGTKIWNTEQALLSLEKNLIKNERKLQYESP